MTRTKTIALNTLSIVLAVALLGFFASIGLVVVGLVLFVGLISLVAIRVARLIERSGAKASKVKAPA